MTAVDRLGDLVALLAELGDLLDGCSVMAEEAQRLVAGGEHDRAMEALRRLRALLSLAAKSCKDGSSPTG